MHKTTIATLIAILMVMTSCQRAPEHPDLAQLRGSYRLIDWIGTRADGSQVAPYGDAASGMIHYSPEGLMSMQLEKPDRAMLGTDSYDSLDCELVRTAFGGFFSYYGTYAVYPEKGVISQYIESCKNPDWNGRTLKRRYQLNGDTLILNTDSVINMNHRLRWLRVK